MATAKVHGMKGNSTYGDLNIYTDDVDPNITYHGTKGNKGPTRNRWHVVWVDSNKTVGPFTTLTRAIAWAHKDNGNTVPPPDWAATAEYRAAPESKLASDMPLIKFKCPSCGHSLVGLVAAE